MLEGQRILRAAEMAEITAGTDKAAHKPARVPAVDKAGRSPRRVPAVPAVGKAAWADRVVPWDKPAPALAPAAAQVQPRIVRTDSTTTWTAPSIAQTVTARSDLHARMQLRRDGPTWRSIKALELRPHQCLATVVPCLNRSSRVQQVLRNVLPAPVAT